MLEKKPFLETIGRRMNLEIDGLENYPSDGTPLIVANHTCLMDIFSVPLAIPEGCFVALSNRLAWKNGTPETRARRKIVERALHGIPLVIHGDKEKLKQGLDTVSDSLVAGSPVVIFPEGAYLPDKTIHRGRTGAARALFAACLRGGVNLNLLPVAIDHAPEDLDAFIPHGDKVKISILKPVEYTNWHSQYIEALADNDFEKGNAALHAPIDTAMCAIARRIGREYKNEYIQLRPRSTMIIESGEEVPILDVDR